MEIPEQDFYEEFFVGKYGDEGLNCKLSSGAVEVDVATSRTEDTVDISAGFKLPMKFGNFECGMTSAGGLNFGVSQNLVSLFDLTKIDELNATANLMIAQKGHFRFFQSRFQSISSLLCSEVSLQSSSNLLWQI